MDSLGVVGAMGQQQQIVELARAVADEVGQQRRRFEREILEHRDERLLFGDDLDVDLAAMEIVGLEERGARQLPADAAPAARGRHQHAQLGHVGRPARARERARDPDDLAVRVDSHEPPHAGVRPQVGLERVRGGLVALLEEPPLAVGHARHEAGEGGAVAWRHGPDDHRPDAVSDRHIMKIV